MLSWIYRYQRLILIAILAFAFVTRVYQLANPPQYVFDEVYHAVTAKLILHGDVRAYEWWNPPPEPNTAVDWLHPPLAKYTQALGMDLFGENSFGWRISSVVFGTLVILAIFVLANQLFANPLISLLAAALGSLDGLLLVQSRVAMNDIHVTFFILLALITYLKFRQRWWQYSRFIKKYQSLTRLGLWTLATGVVIGLAMGSKWSGIFVLGIILMAQILSWIYLVYKQGWRRQFMPLLVIEVLCLVIIPFVVYVGCYAQMFMLGHNWTHFVELERQVWAYQTGLTATHPYQSRPWQWFLDARPVWYHVDYFDDGKIANIYAFGNPLLFWLGDIAVIGTVIILAQKLWQRTLLKKPQMYLKLGLVLLSYLAVWLPWEHSPRIMFFYHYTPAVPFLVILLAFWLVKIWQNWMMARSAIVVALALIVITFAIWYPLWTNIPVSTHFANQIYFAIPSWK